jgi:hypothetical protein
MTLYIMTYFNKTDPPGLLRQPCEVAVFETLKDLESTEHDAARIYEYADGKLTELERKPVYKKVMREVEEIDSFNIVAKAAQIIKD